MSDLSKQQEYKDLKSVFKEMGEALLLLFSYFKTDEKFSEASKQCEKLLEQLERTKASFYKSLTK